MSQGVKLLLWIFGVLALGLGVGMLFQPDISPWYEGLSKSSLTPPDYVFGVVWPILYVFIATAGWYIFDEETGWEKGIYVLQLLLNYSWTPVFFYYQQVGFGLLLIISLSLVTSYLVGMLYHVDSKAAILLTPYLLWIYFATYLNYVIWYQL